MPELRELAQHMLLKVVLRFSIILYQSQHDEQVAANDIAFCKLQVKPNLLNFLWLQV